MAIRVRTCFIRESPELTICPSSSSSSSTNSITHYTHKHINSSHDFHINRLHALKRCAFWPTESWHFPVKTPRYKSTSGQHSSNRHHCLVTRCLLSRGVVCTNAHAYAMYATYSIFGVPWLASTKKYLWNRYKNHFMK